MTSCRTGGAAVAVSASRTGAPTASACAPEQHVVRPEVVAPLADQVRFVHDEQPRPRALERLPGLGFASCSGDRKTNVPGSHEASSAAARAPADCWEFSTIAGRPAACRCAS